MRLVRNAGLAAVLLVVITLVTLVMNGRDFLRAPVVLILLALPLATVNGICEELLWRGLYVRAFPGNFWLAILFPAAAFALWHLAPQLVYPAENRLGFVLSTFLLGLAYNGTGIPFTIYLPTIQATKEGGYGAASGTFLEVGAGERLVNGAITSMQELADWRPQ